MKNLGSITNPKDLVTKEYVDTAVLGSQYSFTVDENGHLIRDINGVNLDLGLVCGIDGNSALCLSVSVSTITEPTTGFTIGSTVEQFNRLPETGDIFLAVYIGGDLVVGRTWLCVCHVNQVSSGWVYSEVDDVLETTGAAGQSAYEAAQAGGYTGTQEEFELSLTNVSNKVDKVDGKQLSTEDYTTSEKTKLSGIAENANNYSHPSTHDVSMILDSSADNVYSGDHKINQLMYFKNNNVANISQVYQTGFYGTKNTDTTTPYRSYWFVAVFCKDPVNKIAVQWAMDVGKAHNGELWMRTVRLNASTTADGNMVGEWRQILNKTVADTLYATLSHGHTIENVEGLQTALDGKLSVDGVAAAAVKASQDGSGNPIMSTYASKLDIMTANVYCTAVIT